MNKENVFARIDKPPSLPEELASVILRQIEGGDFKLGEVLPSEQNLAAMFNVSRTVVREALARLKFEGIIQSKRGSGPVVCSLPGARGSYSLPSVSSVEERVGIIEFRFILEGECASLAALRRTEEQLAAMNAYLQEMQQSIDSGTSGLVADYRFHCLLAEAAHNNYMSSFIKFLSSKILSGVQDARSLYSKQDTQRAVAALAEHRNIHNAIAVRDGKEARNMARAHICNSAAWQNLPLTVPMRDFRSLLPPCA
ncbi:MAG: FadR family transcriptional regulator [Desulfovibrionaceae bacterium]|nr:FadR family transcriptional regulator [Desulfovibrionaceae bacterium]